MKTKFAVCLLAALSIIAAQAPAMEVYVENFSFEEPGTGKIQTDWDRVPGWDSDGVPEDSGVEEYGVATDGTWTVIPASLDIGLTVDDADMAAGTMAFYLEWYALSPGASVIDAAL